MLLTGEGDDACVVTHVQIGSHNSGSWLSHSRRGDLGPSLVRGFQSKFPSNSQFALIPPLCSTPTGYSFILQTHFSHKPRYPHAHHTFAPAQIFALTVNPLTPRSTCSTTVSCTQPSRPKYMNLPDTLHPQISLIWQYWYVYPTSSHRRSLSRGRRSSLLPPSLAPPSHTFLSFTHPILLACLLLSCSAKHRIYVGFFTISLNHNIDSLLICLSTAASSTCRATLHLPTIMAKDAASSGSRDTRHSRSLKSKDSNTKRWRHIVIKLDNLSIKPATSRQPGIAVSAPPTQASALY
jgi:hypothetical protein